jgi:hypothetical protein
MRLWSHLQIDETELLIGGETKNIGRKMKQQGYNHEFYPRKRASLDL